MRFAIVTAQVRSGGDYPITPASASAPGDFRPSWPSASVEFAIGGETYAAVLPRYTDTDVWLKGALVTEARVLVTPRSSAGAHPLLQVIFDVRSYADGGHRVDVTTQNVKDTPEGNNVRYNVSVRLNGSRPYSRNTVDHRYLTRWRKTFPLDLDESLVTPDFGPFYRSGAVMRFLDSVASPPNGSVSGDRYDILTFGDMTATMPMAGGRPEIGFYPYWTAQYLVHRTPAGRAYVLKHGDLSGSWSGHITEPDGVALPTLDRYPQYWIDHRSLGRPNGPHVLNGTTEFLENAHMPSLAYVPYLVTGDRYYVDQQKLWANFVILSTWPLDATVPRSERGLLFQNQVRGIAWGLRNLGDAVASMPDADPDKAYFTRILQNNLDHLAAYGANGFGPLGIPFAGKWGSDPPGWGPGSKMHVAFWMHQYLATTLDHLGDLGFGPVAPLRDRIAANWVAMWNDPGYDRRQFSPYLLYIAAFDRGGTYVAFESLNRAYRETFNPGEGTRTPLSGYYGPEARAGLVLALKLGVPDAAEALAWLESQPGVMDDVNARSGFAIAPFDGAPAPTRRPPTTGPPRRPGPPRNVRIVP
jgi:hypothetical protein